MHKQVQLSSAEADHIFKRRQRIERSIVRQIVKDALASGYSISLDNGDGPELTNDKLRGIMHQMFATDEERLYLYKDGCCKSWVYLVYGNDGYDVICDYSDNKITNELLKNAQALSDKYEGSF